MLERSYLAGVKSMIVTGGSLHESELALSLAYQKGKCRVHLLYLASYSLIPRSHQAFIQLLDVTQHVRGSLISIPEARMLIYLHWTSSLATI